MSSNAGSHSDRFAHALPARRATTIAMAAWSIVSVLAVVATTSGCSTSAGSDDATYTLPDGGGVDLSGSAIDAYAAVGQDGGSNPACEPINTGFTTPNRDGKCGDFDDGCYGKKRSWGGFTAAGKLFTCNACRGGYPNLVGSWRFIDFDTEDPATPLNDGYRETLTFDGNTFSMHLAGTDLGKEAEGTVDGWFFCADGAELANQHAVFEVTKAAPDGLFAWSTGFVWSGDLKVSGSNLLAFGFHFDGFESGPWGEALYCRIGSTIKGHACADPFAK